MTQYEVIQKVRTALSKIEAINTEISGSRHMELADAIAEARSVLNVLDQKNLEYKRMYGG